METYDASIGGSKGLLYVGHGGSGEPGTAAAAAEGSGNDSVGGGTGIRFVRERDGGVPMEFDATRLLSCSPKGRYRMIVSYAEGGGGGGGADDGGGEGEGERRLVTVRVLGTAIDRVIGAVLELAELAEQAEGSAGRDASTAAATAAAAAASADAGPGGAAAADMGGPAPIEAEADGDAPLQRTPPLAPQAGR